jgi:hypothetical protein
VGEGHAGQPHHERDAQAARPARHQGYKSFYTLRHVFRTVADEAKDQPAVDFLICTRRTTWPLCTVAENLHSVRRLLSREDCPWCQTPRCRLQWPCHPQRKRTESPICRTELHGKTDDPCEKQQVASMCKRRSDGAKLLVGGMQAEEPAT